MNQKLTGLKFSIEGTLPTLSRTEVKRLICESGGWVSDRLLRDTDYLIIGDDAGSKQQQAIDLGIPLLTEQKLLQMILMPAKNPSTVKPKSAEYQACYKEIICAKLEKPRVHKSFTQYFDTDMLHQTKRAYGAVLFYECFNDITKEMESQQSNTKIKEV